MIIDDTISRKAAQAKIKAICDHYHLGYEEVESKVSHGGSAYALGHAFDDLPSVEENKWIPIKIRELAEEEKEEYPDIDYMYDCQLPDDGEEVLVTTISGLVTLDTFYRDDGCYFECYYDEGDVVAWMPLPRPYAKGDTE